jgi:thiol-disulfide isomerase/thioredoxin
MRSKSILKSVVVLLILTLVNSCSKSSDNESTNPNTNQLTSISITLSSTTVVLESQDYFTIDVLGNDNVNYSSNSTIYVNGVAITSNAYTPTELGTLEVYAKKGDLISNTVTVEVISGVNGVSVNISNTNVKVNNSIEFSAKDNYNNDVTSESVFYVDGEVIAGSTYTTDVYGDHEVYAIYSSSNGDLQSSAISFNVYRFTKKVLVEDYTGTWCGYCPRLAYNLDQAEQENDAVIGVGVHDDNDMYYEFVTQMEAQYNITGFPSGRINRIIVWNESVSQILSNLGSNPGLGLSINSSLVANNVSVEVKIGYDVSSTNNKIVIYLMEDGLIYPQVNYYNGDPSSPWYQTGNPIQNFEHNNVLRKAFTNIFGDAIPDAGVGDEHTVNYGITVPGSVQNTSNLEIVAFVLNSTTGLVINVQHAPLGVLQDFD